MRQKVCIPSIKYWKHPFVCCLFDSLNSGKFLYSYLFEHNCKNLKLSDRKEWVVLFDMKISKQVSSINVKSYTMYNFIWIRTFVRIAWVITTKLAITVIELSYNLMCFVTYRFICIKKKHVNFFNCYNDLFNSTNIIQFMS